MKKLLIFDAYGTLFSTGTGSVDAAGKILKQQEQCIDAMEFYREWKKLHRIHMEEANQGVFISEQDIFSKDLRVLYERYQIRRPYQEDVKLMLDSLTGRQLFPEVAETIRQLRRRYRVVIGSTTDTEPLLQNIMQNQLDIDAVYTSEMIRKYKPDPFFYHFILGREGYDTKEACFIGDSLVDDVEGPQNAGISAILVDRKGTFCAANGVQPDGVVQNIRGLAGIL